MRRRTLLVALVCGVLGTLLGALLVAGSAVAAAPGHQTAGESHSAVPHGFQDVRAIQLALKRAGQQPGPIDGRAGPRTDAAVRSFQHRRELVVDGVVGLQTAIALKRPSASMSPGTGFGEPRGSVRVRTLQRRLRRVGESPGPIDGLYGPLTGSAVRAFQRAANLTADGLVTKATAAALVRRIQGRGEPAPPRQTTPRPSPAPRTPTRPSVVRPTNRGGDGSTDGTVWLWVLAAACLVLGIVIGALIAGRVRRDPRRSAPARMAAAVAPGKSSGYGSLSDEPGRVTDLPPAPPSDDDEFLPADERDDAFETPVLDEAVTEVEEPPAEEQIAHEPEPVEEGPVSEQLVPEGPVREEPVPDEPVSAEWDMEEPVAEEREPVSAEWDMEEPVAEEREPVSAEWDMEEPVAEEREPMSAEWDMEEPVAEERDPVSGDWDIEPPAGEDTERAGDQPSANPDPIAQGSPPQEDRSMPGAPGQDWLPPASPELGSASPDVRTPGKESAWRAVPGWLPPAATPPDQGQRPDAEDTGADERAWAAARDRHGREGDPPRPEERPRLPRRSRRRR